MRRGDSKPPLTDSEKAELSTLQVLNQELTSLYKDSIHRSIDFEPQSALNYTKSVLLSNPDVLTAWRVRRYTLGKIFNQYNLSISLGPNNDANSNLFTGDGAEKKCESSLETDSVPSDVLENLIIILKQEMDFSVATIKLNCKSYGAWYHRQWLARAFRDYLDLDAEINLCAKLLGMDSRNFHCWNYRICLFDILVYLVAM